MLVFDISVLQYIYLFSYFYLFLLLLLMMMMMMMIVMMMMMLNYVWQPRIEHPLFVPHRWTVYNITICFNLNRLRPVFQAPFSLQPFLSSKFVSLPCWGDRAFARGATGRRIDPSW